MYIELHILQNFAPSNLNRDDTGNPKDTDFGGVRRARISSQCIKRAIRREGIFAKTTAVKLADRTKWITRLIARPLTEVGKDEQLAWSIAGAFVNELGIGTETDKKSGQPKSKVLLYLSKSEIAEIVAALQEKWDDIVTTLKEGKSPALKPIVNEWVKALKNRTSAPDIALFGRMLAEKPDLNLDAACQVAHALSTHRVSMELDYYTAIDDLQQDDETGAGMIGVTAFDSATYYRYARMDWEQLLSNLGWRDPAEAKPNEQNAVREQNVKAVELAQKTVEGFLRAAITAVPTGKQNAFAAQNPPDFLLGVTRKDGAAWSLANAFETPVKADRDGGYLKPSIRALDAYWGRLSKIYGGEGVSPAVLCLSEDAPLENLKEAVKGNREKWIAAILAELE